MILAGRNIFNKPLTTIRINNSFNNGIVTAQVKPIRLYITIFAEAFIIVNALVVSLLLSM